MTDIRKQMNRLMTEIHLDHIHGECYYDLDILKDFCLKLDRAKEFALAFYNENQKEK